MCSDAQTVVPSHRSQGYSPGTQQPQQPSTTVLMDGAPDALGDILGGRGPDPDARTLSAIAIYTSIGNRDAAEFLSRGLRKFGRTRADVQDAVDWTKLHGGTDGVVVEQTRKAAEAMR
jgi:hypothetical protein